MCHANNNSNKITNNNNDNKKLMAKIKKESKLKMPFQKGESSTFS